MNVMNVYCEIPPPRGELVGCIITGLKGAFPGEVQERHPLKSAPIKRLRKSRDFHGEKP